MKKEIAKTCYAVHYLDEELSLLEQLWTNPNETMTTEDYKSDMLNYLTFVEQYQIRRALINTQQFGYIISPEMQEWVDKTIAVRTNKIVKNIAFVLPHDIFEQISIQQTMDEKEGSRYVQVAYFKNDTEAFDWLMKF